MRSPTCSRQKNATFSPHFLGTWGLWICRSLYILEASKNTLRVGKPHFFVCVRTRMQQQQESGRQELSPPLNHFRARGKFESLGIWQREREENGRRGERPLRSGTGVARQSASRALLTQRDQCVWLPHGEEEDDDINPLFLV